MIEISYPAFVTLVVMATIGGITFLAMIIATILHLVKVSK